MSLFPRAFYTSEPSFTPLFRLLDQFDAHYGDSSSPLGSSLKSFQPKFDVTETPTAYELHGELPGIDQKDVEIEFTDLHTLTIRGRTERHYERGTRPGASIEGPATTGRITDAGENSHKATVEDEKAENETSTEVTKHQEKKDVQPASQNKIWVSERTVGEFNRSFNFPGNVDQDGVQASMKNGILSVVVPKATKHKGRKIQISA